MKNLLLFLLFFSLIHANIPPNIPQFEATKQLDSKRATTTKGRAQVSVTVSNEYAKIAYAVKALVEAKDAVEKAEFYGRPLVFLASN